jgi:all-trans-retinol 13,14-reductase
MTAVLKLYRRYIPSLSVVYLSFPSAKDPDWSNRYPSTIDVITLIPYETFEEWAGTMEKKEGD